MSALDDGWRLETVPVKAMKPGKNVRKDPDEPALQALGESLLVRQLVPVILDPEFFIIDGWRRWLAAQRVAIETLKAVIASRPLTQTELHIAQLMMGVHRADLTGGELYTACFELLQLNPAWMAKDLAQQLKVTPSMMTRVLSPSKCIEAVRKALMQNRIGLSHCYEISKVPEEQQLALLELRLKDGASRDELGRQRRKRRGRSGIASRMPQAQCELPGGLTVIVTGRTISMPVIVQALTDALTGARESAKKQHSVKTWESKMRDEAKKDNPDASAA